MQYCRYCSWCISGDVYYCANKEKTLARVDKATKCKNFHLSEFGDVDTGKTYAPRQKAKKLDQIKMNLEDEQ